MHLHLPNHTQCAFILHFSISYWTHTIFFRIYAYVMCVCVCVHAHKRAFSSSCISSVCVYCAVLILLWTVIIIIINIFFYFASILIIIFISCILCKNCDGRWEYFCSRIFRSLRYRSPFLLLSLSFRCMECMNSFSL